MVIELIDEESARRKLISVRAVSKQWIRHMKSNLEHEHDIYGFAPVYPTDPESCRRAIAAVNQVKAEFMKPEYYHDSGVPREDLMQRYCEHAFKPLLDWADRREKIETEHGYDDEQQDQIDYINRLEDEYVDPQYPEEEGQQESQVSKVVRVLLGEEEDISPT